MGKKSKVCGGTDDPRSTEHESMMTPFLSTYYELIKELQCATISVLFVVIFIYGFLPVYGH